MKDDTTRKSSISVLAILCIVFNFLLIANRALPSIFKGLNDNFLLTYFWGVLGFLLLLICLGLAVAAIIFFFFQVRKNPKRAILPFFINVFTASVLYLVPPLFEVIRFKLNKSNYDVIIKMVDEGHIHPNHKGIADLPPKYRHLSQRGNIFINKMDDVTSVFFHRSISYALPVGSTMELISYSGYMYRSNNKPPPGYFMGDNLVRIERKAPNWFYCEHLNPLRARAR